MSYSCYRGPRKGGRRRTSVVVDYGLRARHANGMPKKGTTCVAPCRWVSGQQQRQYAQSRKKAEGTLLGTAAGEEQKKGRREERKWRCRRTGRCLPPGLNWVGAQGWQVKPGTPGTTWHTMSLLAAACVEKTAVSTGAAATLNGLVNGFEGHRQTMQDTPV